MQHVWREEFHKGFCWGNLRERDQLEDPDLDGRKDESSSGQGQVAGTCECGNEPSGYIKYEEFLG